MGFFKKIEGEAAIISFNGVYKQVDLYERDGFLFAHAYGGYIRLRHDGSTSKARARLDHMSWEGPLYRSKTGSLCARELEGAIPLEGDQVQLFLGSAA